MVLDFLYALPAAVGAAVILVCTVGASVAGLLLVHGIVPHGLRRSHNDVASVLIAVVGVVAASIALVLFLIVSFDYPFRGAVGIAPRAFEVVLANVTHEDETPSPTPVPQPIVPAP